MAVPQDSHFSNFVDGGNLVLTDIVVGLRNGLNTRFNFVGEPGVYLPLAGGTMAGAINMNGNVITGLPAPTAPTDAVNKAYADSLVIGAALTEVNDTNVTLTLGGTPATSLLHAVSLTLGWTGQLSVPRGGSGVASFTAYGLICGGTTSTGALQNVSGLGTANQVLVSNGTGALPSWQSVPGVVPSALTEVNDTNVTLTLGGTPATSLLQAVSLTLGWTGTLSGTRGGTGVNNGSNTATFAGNLNFAGAFSTVGAFAVTQTYTAPTSVTFPTSGTLATTSQLPTPAALTEVNDTNVTLTLGGTPTTALLQAVSLTLGWTGQLAVSRGGTGLAAVTAHYLPIGNGTSALTLLAPNATSGIPLISQGVSADPTYGTAVVAGGGTGNTTFTAYSLITAGTTATGAMQNVSGVGTLNQVLISQGAGALPQWGSVPGLTPAALTKTDDTNVTLTLGGTPATALLQAASLTLGWTGQLSVARGGTGLAAITAHNLLIGNGTSAATLLAPSATSGVPLISQGASSDPAYGTAVVGGGGTGNTTFTAYSVLCAGTTATGAFQNVSGVGATGQVLTSNGAAALPTWQNVTGTGTVNSGLINQLAWYAAAGTAVSGLNIVNSAGLLTSAGGVPGWVAYTGSGAPVLATSPTLVTPTLGAATATSLAFSPTTGGIIGTTAADNASAGNVGQFLTNTANGVSMSTTALVDIVTLSLTAGDWDVWANLDIASTGLLMTTVAGWTSLSSATLPTSTLRSTFVTTVAGALNEYGFNVPFARYNVSTTTTIYLTASATFASGTVTGNGYIFARRVR